MNLRVGELHHTMAQVHLKLRTSINGPLDGEFKAPPESDPYPRRKLFDIKRFGKKIAGTKVQRLDLGARIPIFGKRDDWQLPLPLPKAAKQFKAVHIGEPEFEKCKIRLHAQQ